MKAFPINVINCYLTLSFARSFSLCYPDEYPCQVRGFPEQNKKSPWQNPSGNVSNVCSKDNQGRIFGKLGHESSPLQFLEHFERLKQ